MSSERRVEFRGIYEKAIDTLEVLMTKMGMKDQFDRVIWQYEEQLGGATAAASNR